MKPPRPDLSNIRVVRFARHVVSLAFAFPEFFSTCPDDTAEAVLTRYAARWSMEVTDHVAKGQLGFEQPQARM